jgi:hypothetical protein
MAKHGKQQSVQHHGFYALLDLWTTYRTTSAWRIFSQATGAQVGTFSERQSSLLIPKIGERIKCNTVYEAIECCRDLLKIGGLKNSTKETFAKTWGDTKKPASNAIFIAAKLERRAVKLIAQEKLRLKITGGVGKLGQTFWSIRSSDTDAFIGTYLLQHRLLFVHNRRHKCHDFSQALRIASAAANCYALTE